LVLEAISRKQRAKICLRAHAFGEQDRFALPASLDDFIEDSGKHRNELLALRVAADGLGKVEIAPNLEDFIGELSLVVNFDLPWNPQRVEQRIGRCHRYGQKIDVTVVNLLNLTNQAEVRVHQLLDQKFKLFSGVFGASDEVLGAIEKGVDFERRVLEIVQTCRTGEEVEAAFQKLEEELQTNIDADMLDARKKLLSRSFSPTKAP
jgi:hypothetical protein